MDIIEGRDPEEPRLGRLATALRRAVGEAFANSLG